MRTFLSLACWLSWAARSIAAATIQPGLSSIGADTTARLDDLVPSAAGAAVSDCDPDWRAWPAVQRDAVETGTVMVFHLVSRVGNAFFDLRNVMQVCRWLELGIIVNWKDFPGFRQAFDTGEIAWDIDAEPFQKRAQEIVLGVNSTGLHAFRFYDGMMILSDRQVTLLASEMEVAGESPKRMARHLKRVLDAKIRYWAAGVKPPGAPLEPCAWNMLLRRSPSIMKSLESLYPWRDDGGRATPSPLLPRPPFTPSQNGKYVAWQIRTTEGETADSFKPHLHEYIFDGVPSIDVCPWYFDATEEALGVVCSGAFAADGGGEVLPVFISSNSKSMARNCSAEAVERNMRPGFVDLHITDGNSHTSFSSDPEGAARSAFVDFLFLLDAEIVVRTGSSFSGMAVQMKGLKCSPASVSVRTPVPNVLVCVPRHGC